MTKGLLLSNMKNNAFLQETKTEDPKANSLSKEHRYNRLAGADRAERMRLTAKIVSLSQDKAEKGKKVGEITETAVTWRQAAQGFVGTLLASYPPASIAWSGL